MFPIGHHIACAYVTAGKVIVAVVPDHGVIVDIVVLS